MLDRRDPVAQLARAFEVPGVGGLGHLLLERPQDLIRLAVEKHRRAIDGLHVGRPVDQRDAGRGALVQVVVETDLFVARDALVAFPIRKEPVQQVERAVGRARRGVRTEVAPTVVDDAASGDDPRPFLVGDLEVGIRLAVFQHDVVPGLVALDQLVFEDQRLGRGVGADDVEIGDMPHQLAGLRVCVPRRLEVGANPIAQAHRLADVDDVAVRVPHQVDAGGGGKRAESSRKVRGSRWAHSGKCTA